MTKLITIITLSLLLFSCKTPPINEVENPSSVTLQTHVEDSVSPIYKIFVEEDGDLLYFDVKKQQVTKRTENIAPFAASFFVLFLVSSLLHLIRA